MQDLHAGSGPVGAIRIGTAAWAIPRPLVTEFPAGGSVLERYAARFDAVEINSSFRKPHRAGTYKRWSESVPDGFRFAVKLPKTITHEHRLVDAERLLNGFLSNARALGRKLGPLLVQLPPSLDFEGRAAAAFFDHLRSSFDGDVVCEPRHPGWFGPEADGMLRDRRVARVAADPATVAEAAEPGGWTGLVYFRLHGSPQMYRSAYSAEFLAALDARLRAATAEAAWCMFDNTTLGAATANALTLQTMAAAMRDHAE